MNDYREKMQFCKIQYNIENIVMIIIKTFTNESNIGIKYLIRNWYIRYLKGQFIVVPINNAFMKYNKYVLLKGQLKIE